MENLRKVFGTRMKFEFERFKGLEDILQGRIKRSSIETRDFFNDVT